MVARNTDLGRRGGRIRLDAYGADRHGGPVAEVVTPVSSPAPALATMLQLVPFHCSTSVSSTVDMVSPTAKISLAEEPEMATSRHSSSGGDLGPARPVEIPDAAVADGPDVGGGDRVDGGVGNAGRKIRERAPRRTVELQDLREIAFSVAANGEDVGARDRRNSAQGRIGGTW